MAREILKVRKVGGTLVVTLTQSVLDQIPLTEGDRVLIEALPPKRILISKEEERMPSTRRMELELELLESRKVALESDWHLQELQYAHGDLPLEVHELEYVRSQKRSQINQMLVQIAEKRLQLFESQGA